MPWGWVLVSAYVTALVSAGLTQITSPDTAMGFLRDYQTLVAGIATAGALLIAAQQLRRQVDRDAIDAKRHHQAELDALVELDKTGTRLATVASQQPDHYEAWLPYDRSRWDRLRQQVHVSTAGSVSTVMKEVEAYNGLVTKNDDPRYHLSFGFRPDYSKQYQMERTRVYLASMLLLAAVQERREVVLREIEASS